MPFSRANRDQYGVLMLDNRIKLLVTSCRKLIRRNALKNIQTILDKTHAADIALIIQELDEQERSVILTLKIPIEKKSEIISHLDEELQKTLVEKMDNTHATEIVSEMETDDAADLLGNLSEEVSQTILDSMQTEEKKEVTDLMRYPEDTAGGLMSSDYLAFHQSLSIPEVIQKIQSDENQASVTFYIYVIDDNNTLVGVVSLKEIILSKPRETLKDIMTADVVSVPLEMDQIQVSNVVERYDFLSVPVVDETNKLMGVITVDDVIDVIKEEAQENLLAMGLVTGNDETFLGRIKARAPWLMITYFAGVICYNLIWSMLYQKTAISWLAVTAFLPILLAVGATVGLQSVTSLVSIFLDENFQFRKHKKIFLTEFYCSLTFGFIFGALSFVLCLLSGESIFISSFLGIILFTQVVISTFFATAIPTFMKKMNIDPTIASVSLLLGISNITAVLLNYGIAYRLFENI